MHGDPHLSNVLLRRDRPELAAFVDWEMCTVGDPLLDLGLDADLLAAGHRTRSPPGAVLAALGGLATPRANCSMPTWPAGGRETSRLDWYIAMACFKLGIVIEGTWSRYLMGRRAGTRVRRCMSNAQNLIDVGTRVAKGDNPFRTGLGVRVDPELDRQGAMPGHADQDPQRPGGRVPYHDGTQSRSDQAAEPESEHGRPVHRGENEEYQRRNAVRDPE